MISRTLLVCFLSLMVLISCSKKKPLADKRTPIGNDFFLTQNISLPNAQSDQEIADVKKEYYDFNPYNEKVTYYKEPTPKEVFTHHKTTDTFNMQKHIQQQNHEMRTKEEAYSERDLSIEQSPSPTNLKSSKDQKTITSLPTKVVLKPRKKMGLVKVIPKNTTTQSPSLPLPTTPANSDTTAPIQPITLPKKASPDYVPLEDALKYIKQDTQDMKGIGQNKTTTPPITPGQNQMSNNIQGSLPQNPNQPSSANQSPAQTTSTLDNDQESRPIPLPFN